MAARRSRLQLSQVEKESREDKRALSLSRRHCVTKIRELLTEEEPQTWTKNTDHLISMLSTTIKLSDF